LLPPQRHGTGTNGGRPSINHRQIINGILWIVRTGAPCEDLPSRSAKRSTGSTRSYRWIKPDIWERIYNPRNAQADARGEVDGNVHHGDATVIRAHQHAAAAGTLWVKRPHNARRWDAVKVASVPRVICEQRAVARR
jgi:transposase